MRLTGTIAELTKQLAQAANDTPYGDEKALICGFGDVIRRMQVPDGPLWTLTYNIDRAGGMDPVDSVLLHIHPAHVAGRAAHD